MNLENEFLAGLPERRKETLRQSVARQLNSLMNTASLKQAMDALEDEEIIVASVSGTILDVDVDVTYHTEFDGHVIIMRSEGDVFRTSDFDRALNALCYVWS